MPRGTSWAAGFSQFGPRQWLFTYDASLKGKFMVMSESGSVGDSDESSAAMTAPNGMSVFWFNPARMDPAGLAFFVDHELRHFYAFTTTGGNRMIADQEVEIYTAQSRVLGRYGLSPHTDGRYELFEAHCRSMIQKNTLGPIERASAAIQTFKHRHASQLWGHGRAFYIDNAELERIRQGAEELDASIQAASLERDRAESAQRAAALNHGLQMAGPTAPPARDPPYARAGPAAPPALSSSDFAARRTADHEMSAMVAAACRGDWAAAGSHVPSYLELWDVHVRALEANASVRSDGCERSLLYRVAAMRRAGETLDLARLQSETASIMLPPAHDAGPHERERPGDGRPRGGAAPGDRPSQRGAERRLGNGWRGF